MIFKLNRIEIGWTYPCWCVYATLFGSRLNRGIRNWLCDVLSQLVQWIYVTDLLFFDQYVSLVKGCMQNDSQELIFVPLLHGFSNSRVSSAVPYWSIVQYMQRVCWNRFISTYTSCMFFMSCFYYLPDCPTYELLQVPHLSFYIPLEFVQWVVDVPRIVFVARKAIFKLACLKRLVIFCISRLCMRMLPIFCFVVLLWLRVFVFWRSVSSSGCEWFAMEIHYFGLL